MVCSALDLCICTYVWNTAIVSPVHSICLISMSHLTTCARDGLQCALCNWDKDPKPLHMSGPHTHKTQTV